jgi:formylglycine-generating enzyme required for sulfatase activity
MTSSPPISFYTRIHDWGKCVGRHFKPPDRDPIGQRFGVKEHTAGQQTELIKAVLPDRVQLDPRWPPVPIPFSPDQALSVAADAKLIEMPVDRSWVRFYHQLLQEYFAARALGKRVDAGQPLSPFWPQGQCWEPSRWEETLILLSGLRSDASELVARLVDVNVVVAACCLLEGGAKTDAQARQSVIDALVLAISDDKLPPVARVQAGDALGRLGDPRRGVGLRADGSSVDGLPDIAWCEVPGGPFLMGSGDADEMAYDREKPQHEVSLPAFRIARVPVTHAQYAAFVRDGGYTARWRAYWTDAGWDWKGDRAGPEMVGGVFDLPNHPVVGVTWYEVLAFCRWLAARLGTPVTLPTEAQWEKAARGKDGRIFPWGNDADPNRANYDETGVGATSAVGCFPGGASPFGVLDISGNVWEWCVTRWQDSYEDYGDEGDLEGSSRRVVRGGSFYYPGDDARCAVRNWGYPGCDWGPAQAFV